MSEMENAKVAGLGGFLDKLAEHAFIGLDFGEASRAAYTRHWWDAEAARMRVDIISEADFLREQEKAHATPAMIDAALGKGGE